MKSKQFVPGRFRPWFQRIPAPSRRLQLLRAECRSLKLRFRQHQARAMSIDTTVVAMTREIESVKLAMSSNPAAR
jgi:hypothetical protein